MYDVWMTVEYEKFWDIYISKIEYKVLLKETNKRKYMITWFASLIDEEYIKDANR